MIKGLLTLSILLLSAQPAFSQNAKQVCDSLLENYSRNGLYAVMKGNKFVDLSASRENRISYKDLRHFMYVFSDRSRFHPSGAGDDVVLVKSRSKSPGISATHVRVRKNRASSQCDGKRILVDGIVPGKLVDITSYVKHHGKKYRQDTRNYSRETRAGLHFKVRTIDGQQSCVWTDGWGQKTGFDGRRIRTLSSEDISEMFNFRGVQLNRTYAQRLQAVTSALADGDEPVEEPQKLTEEYGSLEAALIFIEETERHKKGCFRVEKPRHTVQRSILQSIFSRKIDWDPELTWLSIERWGVEITKQKRLKARIQYVLRWAS